MSRLSLLLFVAIGMQAFVGAALAQQTWPAATSSDPYAPAYQSMPPWQQPSSAATANPPYDAPMTQSLAQPYGGAAYQPATYPSLTYPTDNVASANRYPQPLPAATPAENQPDAPPDVAVEAANPGMPIPEPITAPPPEADMVDQQQWTTEIVVPAVKWEHSFELGANGTEGNTETFNFRFGYDGTRETKRYETDWGIDYKVEENAGTTIVDELHFEGRHERLFEESPWSIYVHSTFDHDAFAAYDSRLGLDSGVGYGFWKTEVSKLKGRFGAGASKEFGSADDEWKPELAFGLEYEHQLSDRQKLSASCEYFPEIGDFMNSWIVTKVDWELLVDEAWNMSLKVGVRDRYDSTPSGSKHNDLDYSTVLLWKF